MLGWSRPEKRYENDCRLKRGLASKSGVLALAQCASLAPRGLLREVLITAARGGVALPTPLTLGPLPLAREANGAFAQLELKWTDLHAALSGKVAENLLTQVQVRGRASAEGTARKLRSTLVTHLWRVPRDAAAAERRPVKPRTPPEMP